MKFCKSLKFKALAGTLLLAAILCAAFIRIVPDYSISRGFAVVSLSDYNKYKQGYCLKEDRILPKEELYRIAIEKYLDKNLELFKMIDEYRRNNYDFYRPKYKPAYYKIENLNFDNYMDSIIQYDAKKWKPYEFYINKLGAKVTDPKGYLKINLNNMSAGFEKPLLRYFDDYIFILLDYDFILYNDFFTINFFLNEIPTRDILKIYYSHDRDESRGKVYFDNCGDIKYDVEKKYLENRERTSG